MTVRSGVDAPEPPSRAVRVSVRIGVPMRDGAVLAAVLYLPRNVDGAVPVVVEITPYGRDSSHADGVRIAGSGLGFLAVDCRGRGDSTGHFAQMVHDAADGYDVVEWVAAQSFCNGDVAMWGGSYTGMNQWATAAQCPPHLRTIVPGMSAVLGLDTPRGGIPMLWELAWLLMVDGRSMAANLGSDTALLQSVVAEHRASGRPVAELGATMGFQHPELDRVLTMAAWGAHWEELLPTADGFAAIEIPVLSITGQHDNAQLGTLLHHERFWRHASATARSTCHLVIGPWDHASSFTGGDRVGELQFGDSAALDVGQLMIDWIRWVVGRCDKPAFLESNCMFYVAGAEEWRSAPNLDAASGDTVVYALHAPVGLRHDLFHSGWLDAAAAPAGQASFRCGPTHEPTERVEHTPRPEAGGGVVNPVAAPTKFHNLVDLTAGEDPTDQAFATSIDGVGVAYHSAPLPEPIEFVGRPELDLWLSLERVESGPLDADLAVVLSEIRPDGASITLSSQLVRLSTLVDDVVEGAPIHVGMRTTRFFARRMAHGSRLRLVVRSTNSVFAAPPPGEVSVTVHHGPDVASSLRLPLANDHHHLQETP